jgi:hypothetical protein
MEPISGDYRADTAKAICLNRKDSQIQPDRRIPSFAQSP